MNRERIIAICTDSTRCGCAIYYDSCLQLVADRKDRVDPYKGLDILIQKIEPAIIIISSVQKRLIEFLEKRFQFNTLDISRRDTQTRDMDNLMASFLLALVPNTWFSMGWGVQKLLDSEMVKNQSFEEPEQKMQFITSKVEKSTDVCAIRAIAAIDKYKVHIQIKDIDSEITMNASAQPKAQSMTSQLITSQTITSDGITSQNMTTAPTSEQTRSSQFHDAAQRLADTLALNPMPILDVKYIEPGPVLSMDSFTMDCLGLFGQNFKKLKDLEDDQPNVSQLHLLSLYDLLNQCASAQGKRQMRTLMMWPLQEIIELQARHRVIEFLMDPQNRILRHQLMIHLRDIVPLSRHITNLSQSVGKYKDFSIVYKNLWAFVSIIDLIRGDEIRDVELFDKFLQLDSPELRNMVESIVKVVDFESSKKEKRIQICSGVDENVDQKREVITNLVKKCDEVAVTETAKYKDTIGKEIKVIYIPRIGFLSCADYSSDSELIMLKSNSEFDILLHTDTCIYFKSPTMEQLDVSSGDIACDLIDVQDTVVISLQDEILKHTESIFRLTELCGELDCLISFSIVSQDRGFVRPEFNLDDNEIDIRQAFHPLHSANYNVVPNDVTFYNASAGRNVKVMLLTGPNSCGKTTYMKSVCLVVYMAHIGCYVPAVYAKMPIVDSILTRMHSASSISTGLSSFATDLHQINHALNRSTEKSLIVIDEFGKGTQASDGFHLIKGLMIYFATRTQKSPYVIAATHFNRLMSHLQNYSEYILYRTFKVVRDSNDGIIYEFKLIDGISELSLADKVAAKAGVPQFIIDRALQIKNHITENMQIRPRPPSGA